MPITCTIHVPHRRINSRGQGLLTFFNIKEHMAKQMDYRASGFSELFDFRGTETDITTEQVERLVQRNRNAARGATIGPGAIVVDDNLFFGMARMYSTLCEHVGVRIGVFRDLEPAEEWLDSLDRAGPAPESLRAFDLGQIGGPNGANRAGPIGPKV